MQPLCDRAVRLNPTRDRETQHSFRQYHEMSGVTAMFWSFVQVVSRLHLHLKALVARTRAFDLALSLLIGGDLPCMK